MSSTDNRSGDELWLDVLQRISGRAAHEVKGALNGVAVNLEVVRSRSSKPDVAASAVGSFAEAAADQLESLTRMNESLLALARAQRNPVELATVLRQLLALIEPAARSEGIGFHSSVAECGALPVRVPGNATRLALGAALLAALERKKEITCKVELSDVATVRIGSAGGNLKLSPAVVDSVTLAGIAVHSADHGITLVFPRAGKPAHERK